MKNIEKIIDEFEKLFQRNYGWNSQDMAGFFEIKSFLLYSLNQIRQETLDEVEREINKQMTQSIINKVKTQERELVREYYHPRKLLFGLIKWNEVVKMETIKRELNIHIPRLLDGDEVFINGKKVGS